MTHKIVHNIYIIKYINRRKEMRQILLSSSTFLLRKRKSAYCVFTTWEPYKYLWCTYIYKRVVSLNPYCVCRRTIIVGRSSTIISGEHGTPRAQSVSCCRYVRLPRHFLQPIHINAADGKKTLYYGETYWNVYSLNFFPNLVCKRGCATQIALPFATVHKHNCSGALCVILICISKEIAQSAVYFFYITMCAARARRSNI